ncbi:Diaminopimelate decarboxylase [compost metagenome]
MASNYNRIRRPAVVFVQNGHSDLVVRRETHHDIVANDIVPERIAKQAVTK